MTQTLHPPRGINVFNVIAKPLLAAGVPMAFNGLLTVPGRKSGKPRTTALAIVDVDGRAQVAHPLDLAPRRPDPAPAVDVDDRQGRGPRLAGLPAGNSEQAVEGHRDASRQERLRDRVEHVDAARRAQGLGHRSLHSWCRICTVDPVGPTNVTRNAPM
jgi:hypothetical protein